jgi:hypothetical protein
MTLAKLQSDPPTTGTDGGTGRTVLDLIGNTPMLSFKRLGQSAARR